MSWGSNSSANKLVDTYVRGFLDISGGDVQVQTGNVILHNTVDAIDSSSGTLIVSGGASVAKSFFVGNNLSVLGDTNSTDTASGSLQISGGAGIAKNVFIGGNSTVTGNSTV